MKKEYSLFLLCIADTAFTGFGEELYIIEEANPLMLFLQERSWMLFYLIKIVLPAALLILTRDVQSKLVNVLLKLALILYGAVTLYHVGWITLYWLLK
ncbi:hypothetical protein CVD28_13875 [Bacillus sp. M6-12]|uniref:DUF5658 family protein n=1 Tax=Bacillus sp. M6-12 TaxID=2054166 RepID=UPI000C75E1D6|nr:DUF5658 family protein [Bacillus sp. M6-12]PLS17137.1 hypothetical protein CVD28_13875 [Bacillus sp. M6-12]